PSAPTLFPYTTLFRSRVADHRDRAVARAAVGDARAAAALGIAAEIAEDLVLPAAPVFPADVVGAPVAAGAARGAGEARVGGGGVDRKSTRLNSSHVKI